MIAFAGQGQISLLFSFTIQRNHCKNETTRHFPEIFNIGICPHVRTKMLELDRLTLR